MKKKKHHLDPVLTLKADQLGLKIFAFQGAKLSLRTQIQLMAIV